LSQTKNDYKLIRSAIELEGDAFATHRKFDKNDEKDCITWGNALDLALNIKNKYQLQFSINYPNYANITDVPQIAALLMSEKARERFIESMNPSFKNKTNLLSNTKSLSFQEFVIITRASPAKSLGLSKFKGHLDIDADGDVNILDINANEFDLNKEPDSLEKVLTSIEYVVKNGEIIKKQDNINLEHEGKILWSRGKQPEDTSGFILTKKKEFYQKYNSNFYDSIKISIENTNLRNIN
jgi:formylmethanofuran dehydrogenase subunit A